MDRLTKRVFGTEAYIYNNYIYERPFTCENKQCYMGKGVELLAEYEETNLTPAEITTLKAENERLKEKNKFLQKAFCGIRNTYDCSDSANPEEYYYKKQLKIDSQNIPESEAKLKEKL